MDSKLKREIEQYKQEELRKNIVKRLKEHSESHSGGSMSRRDLLGAGVLSFAASLTLPTLAGMLLPRIALAQEACPSSVAGASFSPFVTLNLAGGAMLAANYVPMDQGGQTLSSYNKMGLGNSSLNIEREFGNVPFAGDDESGNGVLISKLLTELRANTTPDTLAKTAFVAIPVRSRDDFSGNPFDITGMVAKAGLVGSDLPNLGKRASDTGIGQYYSKVKPPTPLIVGDANDIAGALGIGASGALVDFSDEQKVSLVKLVKRMSEGQVSRVNNLSGGRMLASLVNCATQKNIELAEKTQPNLDVRQDANLSTIWGVNNGTNSRDSRVVFGTMVNAGLNGYAGTVNLEQGGFDYHNGTRTLGDQRDGEAGATIGRVLQSAAVLGKKVFIYVTSDGSCVSEVSESRTASWRSDRGSAGIAYMLAFDPAGRPATSGFQIGQFTDGQAADDKFITGGNPELAAAAAFSNYLKFNKRMDLITPVLGSTFSTSDLDKIIKFA